MNAENSLKALSDSFGIVGQDVVLRTQGIFLKDVNFEKIIHST